MEQEAVGTSHGSIFCVLSDGTGETAEQILKAALLQFSTESKEVRVVRFKNIRKESQVDHIIEKAKNMNGVIVFTLVSDKLREWTLSRARELKVPVLDVMGPVLGFLGNIFGRKAENLPGLLHQTDSKYYDRITAIEYTVKHDDGRVLHDLDKADIILVGISRTSKTPLSIFLSHKGYKVANVPIVNGIELPTELFKVDQRKIVGLEIDSEILLDIRRNRVVKMGQGDSEYASHKHIIEELEYSKQIFKRNKLWPVFNVTGKALEEIALDVETTILRVKSS